MPSKYLLFQFAILSLLVSGCCSKVKKCPEAHVIRVYFNGFMDSDLDTVIVTGYTSGTDFSKVWRAAKTENLQYTHVGNGSYLFASDDANTFTDGQDWEVYVPATGSKYRIYGYTIEKLKCNTCAVLTHSTTVTGFYLNGTYISGTIANLRK
jgi:hypothetical protein